MQNFNSKTRKNFTRNKKKRGGIAQNPTQGVSAVRNPQSGDIATELEDIQQIFRDHWAAIGKDSIEESYDEEKRQEALNLREERAQLSWDLSKIQLDPRNEEDIKNPDKTRSWEELQTGLLAVPSREEIHTALHGKVTKDHKAAGMDAIPGIMLRAADESGALTRLLTPLYQACWRNGCFVKIWKSAMCVPLRKVDDKEAGPDEYRLIALLNLIGKIYESVIEVRIGRFLEQLRNVPEVELKREGVEDISNMQYGFRHDPEGRSTCDAKWNLANVIRAHARRRKKTYACFLDIKKAYPRTNHAVLLKACHKQGVRGHLYSTIDSHLTDRRHIIQLGHSTEDLKEEHFYPIERGLAEGSLLSPVLFTIYINSIVSRIRAAGRGVTLTNSKGEEYELGCLLYADDLVIIAENADDLNQMLAAAHEWACEHQTEFNFGKNKTEYVVFGGQGLGNDTIMLGNTQIQESLEYRYLGHPFSQELGYIGNRSIDYEVKKNENAPKRTTSGGQGNKGWSFSPHIKSTAMRMYNKRGIAKCMGGTAGQFSIRISRTIYKTFIESLATFDTPVWAQDATKDENLEREQVTCAKQILGIPTGAKVCNEAVRSELGIMSLKMHRNIADLIYAYRLSNMSEHRLERQFYEWLRNDTPGAGIFQGCGSSVNWSVHIDELLKKFELDPSNHSSMAAWKKAVFAKAWDLEETQLITKEKTANSMNTPYPYTQLRNSS